MRIRKSGVAAAILAASLTALALLAGAQATYDRPLEMDRGAVGVWQSLKQLHTRASLILVTAHPDDEDSGMLTYETRGQGARAATLTLNRGEGGQNVMSDDFYDALGLVRTQELLASDRYFGVRQYFTRVVDFGFSKTQQGTLDKWGHDRVLADVVRVIREDRPLVVASVFVGGPSDGHGNHIVAGEMAQEAYAAAADPKMFPDQIQQGLRPWKALKMYARAGGFGGRGGGGTYRDYIHGTTINGPLSMNVQIPQGQYDPVLGSSYTQISRQGLSEQRTQNGGIGMPDLAPAFSTYHLFDSKVEAGDRENSFFDGIDTSLAGIADLAPAAQAGFLRDGLMAINKDIEEALSDFSVTAPEKTASALARGLSATNRLVGQVQSSALGAEAKDDVLYELKLKQEQFNEAITRALGLYLNANVTGEGGGGRGGPAATFQTAIPGQQFGVQVHVAEGSGTAVQLTMVELRGPAGENWTLSKAAPPAQFNSSQPANLRFEVTVPVNAAATRPYYSRPNTEQAYYNIDDPRYLTLPEAPYPLTAKVQFTYLDVGLELSEAVQTVEKINGLGNLEYPLVVAPAISVAISPHAGVVPLTSKSLQVTVTVHSNVKGAAEGEVELRLPAGWHSTPATASFSLAHDGEDHSSVFEVQPSEVNTQSYTITAVARYAGKTYEEGYHTAGYPGLRPYNLYSPATYSTRGVNLIIPSDLNVGYVAGSGDEVPQSLENVGVKVHFLSGQDLQSADLSRFDAIVLGIRAYEARLDLRASNGRLLEYVRDGGTLVVQYNFSVDIFGHNYGPYPLSLSTERVMDEHSAVQILAPDSAALNWPNKITAADFTGWFEERGHGFMGSWDPRYTPLVEMHDPDQAPQRGGLLYAAYGKGTYIYEGLALYRQLPEGVPGAYRLFVNLLSSSRRKP